MLCLPCLVRRPRATLGQRLRARRIALGLGRLAFARLAGVGVRTDRCGGDWLRKWGCPRGEVIVLSSPDDRVMRAAFHPKATKGLELQGLLRPYPAEAMTAYPVATRVNSPKHNAAACVAPLAG